MAPTRRIVEPHITVKAQAGLTEGMAWVDRMAEVGAVSRALRRPCGDRCFLVTPSYISGLHPSPWNGCIDGWVPP